MAVGDVLNLSSVEGDQGVDDQGGPDPKLFKMQDLMQAVAENSDLKRSELRSAAGLICDALGQALQEERIISLPGLGKIIPRKRDSKPSGDILTTRIKLTKPAQETAGETDEERDENP